MRAKALVAVLTLATGLTGVAAVVAGVPGATAAAGCRIYVAAGDDIPAGHDLDDQARRFPEQLRDDHIEVPGWCLFNQRKNGTTSSTFITGGGLSSAYNMRPDFLTISLGEQTTRSST